MLGHYYNLAYTFYFRYIVENLRVFSKDQKVSSSVDMKNI